MSLLKAVFLKSEIVFVLLPLLFACIFRDEMMMQTLLMPEHTNIKTIFKSAVWFQHKLCLFANGNFFSVST